MSPHHAPVLDIVVDVAEDLIGHAEGLAILRARGYVADPDALTDAVTAHIEVDGLISGYLDPLAYLDNEPRPGLHAIEVAVDRATTDLDRCLQVLGRRRVEVAG